MFIGIGVIPDRATDADAGSHDIDVGTCVRPPPAACICLRHPLIALVNGTDRDHIGVGSRIRRSAHVVIAHGGNQQAAFAHCIGDGVPLDEGIAIAAQAQVDDVRTVVRRPANARGNVNRRAHARRDPI